MTKKEKQKYVDYLKSLGMSRRCMRHWSFPDDIIHWNYYLVYERDGVFSVYTRSIPKKFENEYRIITKTWVNFSGDFEGFKKCVNGAVKNYKAAVHKIKELKALEDFK